MDIQSSQTIGLLSLSTVSHLHFKQYAKSLIMPKVSNSQRNTIRCVPKEIMFDILRHAFQDDEEYWRHNAPQLSDSRNIPRASNAISDRCRPSL
jgi:hypothetical protein